MYVQIILSPVYVGNVFHAYLNALYNGKKNGWAIITNQEYVEEPLQYEAVFFKAYDMETITEDERSKVKQLGIKKDFFENKVRECGSWTSAKISLFSERDSEFERLTEEFLKGILSDSNERIEGFLVFGEAYESIRYIAQKYGYTIINFEFSSFRRIGGYPLNVMYGNTNGRLYSVDEGERRYKIFEKQCTGLPFFSRREIIALIGQKEFMPLLPLLDLEGVFEVGICGMGEKAYPQTFCLERYTDEDIWRKCLELYSPEEVIIREHPVYLNKGNAGIETMRREPIHFILASKRVAGVYSNTLLEAMLWNRVVCSECNLVSFSFACERDFTSKRKVDEIFLNFFILSYLIPGQQLLFDPAYWKWRRLLETTETDIYRKHVNYILGQYGLDDSLLQKTEEERFKIILKARGYSETEIEKFETAVSDEEIDYKVLISCMEGESESEGVGDKKYCLNKVKDGTVTSEFTVDDNCVKIHFYPYTDIAGIVKIDQILINGVEVYAENRFKYISSQGTVFELEPPMIMERNSKLTIRWQYKEFSLADISELTEKQNCEIEAQNKKVEALNQEVSLLRQSVSWKVTKPLRKIKDLLQKV